MTFRGSFACALLIFASCDGTSAKISDEAATDEDISEMRRLLRESLEAGAVGFSTGRSDNHRYVYLHDQ